MNLPDLNRVFGEFSGDTLVAYRKNTLANANQLYIVTTASNKKYAIKFLETQNAEGAKSEITIQQKMRATSIRTPRYLPLKNREIVGTAGSKRFVVYKYVEGVQEKTATIQLIHDMGVTLAKIHQSIESVAVPFNGAQWLRLDNVRNELSHSSAFNRRLSEMLDENIHIFGSSLPQTVIHGDLTLNNLLTKNGKVTAIFDFETAEKTLRILDIARTFLSLTRTTEHTAKTILSKLSEGYNSAADIPLTKAELLNFKAAIRYVAVACAACA